MTKNFRFFIKQIIPHSNGFSMTELMVAIAIIGILSAIAVPAYIHQVNQSHQNEAKSNLTSLDAAMKSFWAEYATNTSDLDLIGWKPTGSLSYNYGWLGGAGAPVLPANILGAHGTGCYATTSGAGPCLAAWAGGFQNLNSATTAGAFTGANSFSGAGWTAYARANLRAGQNDQWTIDSHDTLTNTLNGI